VQKREKGKKMFCPKCGKELQADSTFCPSCGAKLGDEGKPVARKTSGVESEDPSSQQRQYSSAKRGWSTKRKILVGCGAASLVLFIAVVGICVAAMSGSSVGLNDNPPDYVKDVVALEEGSDGLSIYFILADASEKMTTSESTVTLTIVQDDLFSDAEVELYSRVVEVKKADFQEGTAGLGAFKHEVIAYRFARLDYSSFKEMPSESSGKVRIEFKTPDGRILTGEDTVFF